MVKKGRAFSPTGSRGLDEALGGGFIANNSILVGGPPGSGKTTLAFQFLHEGTKRGEAGAFISFDEEEDRLIANTISFNWNIEELEHKDLLRIQKVGALEIQQFASQESILLIEIIRSINAKRVVVDSLTTYELLFKQDYERMLYVKRLIEEIVNRGCTFMATSEAPTGRLSRFGLSEFIFDSVLHLDIEQGAKPRRTIEIVKNRGQPHRMGKLPMEITPNGIEVKAH
jgi:KaiC/GvpD/RAD55 family RecA-like ATPase